MTEHKSADRRFEVGEVAIFARRGSRFEGMDVVITQSLHFIEFDDSKDGKIYTGYVYGIDGDFGPKRPGIRNWVCRPEELRKKRPPQDWVKLCRLHEVPAESEGVPA